MNQSPKFQLGDRVSKVRGSQWTGVVVGTYATTLTPEGYAVESETERGSVQIYPAAALESAPATAVVPAHWQPIDTAPQQGREMFVVKAFNVMTGAFSNGRSYTSDPWCVWRAADGGLARWPHEFQPTHWMPLAPAPQP